MISDTLFMIKFITFAENIRIQCSGSAAGGHWATRGKSEQHRALRF